jgi:hypothetical protein
VSFTWTPLLGARLGATLAESDDVGAGGPETMARIEPMRDASEVANRKT